MGRIKYDNDKRGILSGEKRQINIIFRYDDYSARSTTESERKIIEIFQSNNVSLTFGVIPFVCEDSVHDTKPQVLVPLTDEKIKILNSGFRNGILDIGLHGYSHQRVNNARKTEFSGIDYKTQVEKIAIGKEFLERVAGAPVRIFIPPWNKYDANTLRALEYLGFSTISALMSGVAKLNSKLNFIPQTISGLSQVRDVVKTAQIISRFENLIVVVFHAYDFEENNRRRGNITFKGFSDLLQWIKSQDNSSILSISQANNIMQDLSVNRFLLNRYYHKWNAFHSAIFIRALHKKSMICIKPNNLISRSFSIGIKLSKKVKLI